MTDMLSSKELYDFILPRSGWGFLKMKEYIRNQKRIFFREIKYFSADCLLVLEFEK